MSIEPSVNRTRSENPWGDAATPYEAIGGDEKVRELVERFYWHVEHSSEKMREIHPDDLTESRQKLYEFLSGWLGGPQLYMQKRGHPRLRMRHMPFPIDDEAVSEWLRCMGMALDECGVEGQLRAFLDARFTHTANFMKNTGSSDTASEP